jgi:NAD(P)-dependent dehydrogenase (short-subunit alcohol dehydrogenase family)
MSRLCHLSPPALPLSNILLGDIHTDRSSTVFFSHAQLGLKPKFHQLDITKKESVTALRDYLVGKYGGLDVLVNNAAIAFKVC